MIAACGSTLLELNQPQATYEATVFTKWNEETYGWDPRGQYVSLFCTYVPSCLCLYVWGHWPNPGIVVAKRNCAIKRNNIEESQIHGLVLESRNCANIRENIVLPCESTWDYQNPLEVWRSWGPIMKIDKLWQNHVPGRNYYCQAIEIKHFHLSIGLPRSRKWESARMAEKSTNLINCEKLASRGRNHSLPGIEIGPNQLNNGGWLEIRASGQTFSLFISFLSLLLSFGET